jgi:hypothetical protein
MRVASLIILVLKNGGELRLAMWDGHMMNVSHEVF